jgi:hypothetical protein
MPVRFRRWQLDRRTEIGAQFFMAGPVIDPATVVPSLEALGRRPEHPPIFLMLVPPFGLNWVERAEGWGSVPAGEEMRKHLADYAGDLRSYAWEQATQVVEKARAYGCAGVVLTGVKFENTVSEAAHWLRSMRLAPDQEATQPHVH